MPITHPEIDERQIPERFVLDRLSDAERDMFETHLIDCEDCQNAIRAAGALNQGLSEVRAEFLEPARAAGSVPFWARPIRLWQGVALAAVCSFLTLAPGLSLRRQLARSQSEESAALENADRERREANSLRTQLGDRKPVPQALAVYPLELSRGAGSEHDAVTEIAVPKGATAVALMVSRDAARDASAAELQDAAGKTIWSVAPLPGGNSDTIGLTAPANLLAPGRYELVMRTGEHTAAARFSFRVTARN
jgi:Putative zinc-finger